MNSNVQKGITLGVITVIVIAIIAAISSNSNSNDNDTDNQDNILNTTEMNSTDNTSKLNKYNSPPETLATEELKDKKVVLETEKGTIEFELFGDEAPDTVTNFIFLTNDGYYDNLTFHRREEGFVIQGGDPAGNGTGGPGYTFADEPVNREYTRGIVAMANAGPDTNGSQFFIMLENNPLPPQYTIFGEVTSGMDVVDKIQIGDKMTKVTIEDK